jgi:hypothetical protein
MRRRGLAIPGTVRVHSMKNRKTLASLTMFRSCSRRAMWRVKPRGCRMSLHLSLGMKKSQTTLQGLRRRLRKVG